MQGVARNFFTLAIIYSLCGMALGLHMSITHDHGQMPVHAHTMVAGWLMSAVFAFFYHLFPAARDSMLARVHFWLTAVSGIGLLVGLFSCWRETPRSNRWSRFPRWSSTPRCCCSSSSPCRPSIARNAAVACRDGLPLRKKFRGPLTLSLSFTGVYYAHPVIWILTGWLEPLCLTPPC